MDTTGYGDLRLMVHGTRWRTRYQAPLFVNVLRTAGDTLLAMPSDQGGGLRTGDRHRQRLLLDHGAEVTWAPPASTLCMPAAARSPTPQASREAGTAPAHLQLVADVRGASYLRVAGRPLIPFAGADVQQTTVVRLAAGSQCLLVESGCPGRTQMGESWAFTYLAYHLTILNDRTVVYRERWQLCPPAVPHGPSGFGGYLGWATCVASGARAVTELHALRRWLADNGATVSCGTLAADLAVARILDPHGYLVTALATRAALPARAAPAQPAGTIPIRDSTYHNGASRAVNPALAERQYRSIREDVGAER